jgi:hypothetical protein
MVVNSAGDGTCFFEKVRENLDISRPSQVVFDRKVGARRVAPA